ncbi:unnamed protein product, partial [Ectocarpus fasciculatus]
MSSSSSTSHRPWSCKHRGGPPAADSARGSPNPVRSVVAGPAIAALEGGPGREAERGGSTKLP